MYCYPMIGDLLNHTCFCNRSALSIKYKDYFEDYIGYPMITFMYTIVCLLSDILLTRVIATNYYLIFILAQVYNLRIEKGHTC